MKTYLIFGGQANIGNAGAAFTRTHNIYRSYEHEHGCEARRKDPPLSEKELFEMKCEQDEQRIANLKP